MFGAASAELPAVDTEGRQKNGAVRDRNQPKSSIENGPVGALRVRLFQPDPKAVPLNIVERGCDHE